MLKTTIVMTLSLMMGTSFAFAKLSPAEFQQKQIELITKQLHKIKISREDYQKMLKFKAKVTKSEGPHKKRLAKN